MPVAPTQQSSSYDTRSALEAFRLRVQLAWMEQSENPNAYQGHEMWTREWNSDGLQDQIVSFGPGPQMEVWDDQKKFERFRIFDFQVGALKYHKGIELDMDDIIYDRGGAISEKISRWVATNRSDIGRLMHRARQLNSGAGPVGFDGTNVYSATHPFGPPDNANQSNVTAAALSFTAFDEAKTVMMSLRNEKGDSYEITPNVLEVGPSNQKIARQIAHAHDRVVPVSALGVQDVSSDAIAAASMANVYQGDVTVVINPQLVGTAAGRWYLHDTSKPGAKGFGFKLLMDSKLTEKLDDKDDNVFLANKGLLSVVLKGTPHADWWPVTYGGGIS